jgi:tetratricopeptide (TPR) repeat protein
LTIVTNYYLSGHLDIVCLFNNIGIRNLYDKENYEEALHFHQQALTMLEPYYPSYYANIADTLNYIGNILRKQEKYNEALDVYYRALKIQEDYYSSDHVQTVSSLINIGHTLFNQTKADEALVFYQRALTS